MCPVNIYIHIYNTLSRVYNVHVYIHVYCYTSIRLIFKRVARTKMARSNLLITIRRDETDPFFLSLDFYYAWKRDAWEPLAYWGERNSLWRRALNEQRQACRSSFTECNIGREREPIVALDGYSTCIRSRRGQCIEVPFVCRSTPKASTAGGVVGKLPMASSPLLPTAFTSHQSEASTPQLSTSTDLAFQHPLPSPLLLSKRYSYLCSCLHSFLPLPLLVLPSFEPIEYFYEKFRSQSINHLPIFLVIFVEHHWKYDCKLY